MKDKRNLSCEKISATDSQPPAPDPQSLSLVVIFPGALGDFLCCLPALEARRAAVPGGVRIFGRDSWLQLIEDGRFETHSIESRAISELHRPGAAEAARSLLAGAVEIHSWTGYGDRDFAARLRVLSGAARVEVHPFRAFAPREHAVDYYARCLGVRPAETQLQSTVAARQWARAWIEANDPHRRPLLLIHAGSGSRAKNWSGFDEIAGRWAAAGGFAAELVGSAEERHTRLRRTGAVVEESLPRVVALLERAGAYAGNDSGITHLAAAVGASGVAVFRREAVAHWRPRSPRIEAVIAPGEHAETGIDTRAVTVAEVWEAMRKMFFGPKLTWRHAADIVRATVHTVKATR